MESIDHIGNLPELAADTIHIWGVHVPTVLDRMDALHEVLCEAEREKASRFRREQDRSASIAARGALRILLSGYTGIPAVDLQFTYSENGKPSLVSPAFNRHGVSQASRLPTGSEESRRDACDTKIGRRDACGKIMGRRDACDTVAFNVSHSGDWVVLAFGRDRNVGVDVERIKWDMDVQSIAARYYSPEEQLAVEQAKDSHLLFFRIWARKEAYVKACGSTLFNELKRMSVPLEDGAEMDGWYFQRLEAGSNYAAAVVTDKPVDKIPCYDFGGLKWES